MKKKITTKMQIKVFIIVLFLSAFGYAQNPNWEVDENDYEHTMTFVIFLNLDGVDLSSTDDEVATFVGDEIRGVTNLTYVASVDRYFAYLTAFANTNGETLSFRIYDSTNDVVRNVSTTKIFEINGHQGDIFQAVSIADPLLNTEAEILDFSFNGVTAVNTLIDAATREVIINVDQSPSDIETGIFSITRSITLLSRKKLSPKSKVT